MKVIFSTFYLFFILNTGIAQNNSFNGTFLNEEIGLSITLIGNDQAKSGQFKLNDQAYPITASMSNESTLIGSYPYYGTDVPIQLMKINGNFILISEGISIPLIPTNTPEKEMIDGSASVASNQTNTKTAINIAASSLPNSGRKADGRAFSDPFGGFYFNIPKDWVGRQLENGTYLIGHNTKPGFVLILPHEYQSLNELYQEAIKGIHEDGIQLLPNNGLQKFSKNGLIGAFEGSMQGQSVKAYVVSLMSPFKGGLTMLTAVRTDLYKEEYLDIVQSIAASVAFSQPKESPVAKQWTTRLNGKKLQYLNTKYGISDKIVINLCTNGQFGYSNNSSGMSGGASTLTYASQDGGQGTWKIINRGQLGVLILNFNNGELAEYQLTNRAAKGEINMNGRRYFVENSTACY